MLVQCSCRTLAKSALTLELLRYMTSLMELTLEHLSHETSTMELTLELWTQKAEKPRNSRTGDLFTASPVTAKGGETTQLSHGRAPQP